MSLRDEALREMASAIEDTFDGPPTDWTPEAEVALDALCAFLTDIGRQIETRVDHPYDFMDPFELLRVVSVLAGRNWE